MNRLLKEESGQAIWQSDELSPENLRSRLRTGAFGREIIYYDQTDSTNLQAAVLAEAGAVHGTLVTAQMQSAGRGRRGRSWQQERGTAVAMSLILRPDTAPDKASMLTLAAAHAIVLAIERMSGEAAYIKWPNDIVMNGKKIVGILTEMHLAGEQIADLIVGIGINVGTEHFPQEIARMASSLYLETGKRIDRCELTAEILFQFEKDYEEFLKRGDLSGILESYNAHLINRGKEVRILDEADGYTGISRGILKTGELLVEREDGRLETVYAGEVSVRGLYGYV